MAGKGGPEAVASMKQILAQTKEIEKSVGGFGTATSKATEKVGALDRGFASLGKTMAGVFAAGALANFLRDSYVGFAKTERQALAVENQIKALGQAAQGAGFRDFISQLSSASGILDDDIVPAFQRAISTFKNYGTAQEIVTMASKFAAAGIGEVGSNVDALARFFQTGMARSLVQFGVNVKGGEAATLDLNEGLAKLREQLGLLPKSFDDAQSRINIARLAWDGLSDAVGGVNDRVVEFVQHSEAVKYAAAELLRFGLQNATGFGAARAGVGAPKPAGAFIGPLPQSAADKQFADEQVARDKKANADKLVESEKTETERLAKIAELNEKSGEALLKGQIDFAEKGSSERLALELELNKKIEAAAIENAKKIGASTVDIEKLFAIERGKIIASKGETQATKDAREAAAAFDPRAGFDEVDAAYLEHEEKLKQIQEAGVIQRLTTVRDLTLEGTQSRLDAELELERAALQIKSDQEIRAAKGDVATISAIRQTLSKKEISLIKITQVASEEAANQRMVSDLKSAAAISGTLSQTFQKQKAFSIAMAIINTALGITAIWKDESIPSYWLKIAATVAVAAAGYAQIQTIRSANIGSGGAQGTPYGSAPLTAAPPVVSPTQNIVPYTPGAQGSSPSAGMRAPGSSSFASPEVSLTVNVGTVFGDKRSLANLTTAIERVIRNNQQVLR